MKKGHFEAKKHSYRQTQDGIVISFVVHPDDVSSELALAPLGTMYMIGFAKVGDDSKPEVGPKKERTPFGELSLSAQAAIRSGDPEFMEFMLSQGFSNHESHDIAQWIRECCAVDSRAEFNTDECAANRWKALDGQFRQWQTDRRYESSRTR